MAAKKKTKKKQKRQRSGWFFKLLIFLVVLHGMGCVSMSYALAWRDHLNIVETVSSTIISQIIAPVIVYGATKTIENIFEKNKLAFSEPITKDPQSELQEPPSTLESDDEWDGQLTFLPEFENGNQ